MNSIQHNTSLHRALCSSEVDLPEKLQGKVLVRVAQARRRQATIRLAGLSTTALVAVVSLWPALVWAAQEFYLSGFVDYIQLLFTDRDVISASWSEFALSLFESLPALPLAIICAALLTAVWALVRAGKNMRIVATPYSLAA